MELSPTNNDILTTGEFLMIEVDDAGNGCPILGEVFAARRMETGEHAAVYIPLQRNGRQNIKEEHIMSLLEKLNVRKDEKLLLCRGNTLNGFSHFLEYRGYHVERGKISEETDQIAEAFFMECLYEIGFPRTCPCLTEPTMNFIKW